MTRKGDTWQQKTKEINARISGYKSLIQSVEQSKRRWDANDSYQKELDYSISRYKRAIEELELELLNLERGN